MHTKRVKFTLNNCIMTTVYVLMCFTLMKGNCTLETNSESEEDQKVN